MVYNTCRGKYHKNGSFKEEKSIIEDSSAHLQCLLKGKNNIEYMVYPHISSPSKEGLFKSIQIALEAQRKNVKYIKVLSLIGKNENFIIIYKNPVEKDSALLLSYILKTLKKKYPFFPLHPQQYIYYKMANYDEDSIYGFYINRYINHLLPKKLKSEVEKIDRDVGLSYKDKYMKKYRLVKGFDNFRDFHQKYEKIKEDARRIVVDTKKSKEFGDYVKKTKIEDFKFIPEKAIGINPLYDEKMAEQVKKIIK